MVPVHVIENVLLAVGKRRRGVGVGGQRRALQPHGAGEAADVAGPFHRHGVEMKVAEPGVPVRLGMPGEKAAGKALICGPGQTPHHGHPRAGLRIGPARRLLEQQGRAPVGLQVAGVVRQPGQQHDGASPPVAGHGDQRRVGPPGGYRLRRLGRVRQGRRQRRPPRPAHEAQGGGAIVRGCGHGGSAQAAGSSPTWRSTISRKVTIPAGVRSSLVTSARDRPNFTRSRMAYRMFMSAGSVSTGLDMTS